MAKARQTRRYGKRFLMMVFGLGIMLAVGAAYAAIRAIQLNSAVSFPVDI